MNKTKYLKKMVAVALSSACLFGGSTPALAAMSTHAQLGRNIPITAEFKDTALTDALDALSKLSGIPIIIHGTLSSNIVTLNSDGQSLATILDNLSMAFGLSYIEQDGMIVVSTKDVMTTTETFKLKYLDLEEVKNDLKTFLDDDDAVSVSNIDNSITISGSAADVARARRLIEAKDVKPAQVTIQAKLIELSKDDVTKLGFNHSWNDLHSTDSHVWSFKWKTQLTAEETESTGKVLARPTVSTINGKEATISIVDKVPILTTTTSNNDTTTTVDYQDVGVILKTTPRINEDTGYVTLDINPSVSTITGYVSNNNVNAPQTAQRSVQTTLRVRSGETIVIGGLLKTDDIMGLTKIPILGDLPIFGKLLFQYKNHQQKETELVVMITPYIEGDALAHNPEDRLHNIHSEDTMERVIHLDRKGNDDRTDETIGPKSIYDGKKAARQREEQARKDRQKTLTEAQMDMTDAEFEELVKNEKQRRQAERKRQEQSRKVAEEQESTPVESLRTEEPEQPIRTNRQEEPEKPVKEQKVDKPREQRQQEKSEQKKEEAKPQQEKSNMLTREQERELIERYRQEIGNAAIGG